MQRKFPNVFVKVSFLAGMVFVVNGAGSQPLTGPYSKTLTGTSNKKVDSPNGRFSVELDSGSPTRHLFFIRKSGTESKKEQINIPESDYDSLFRGIDILWSPDSSYFIMNNWTGSERTVSYFCRVDSLKKPININLRIKDTLIREIGQKNFDSLNFLYVYAERILTSRSVRIRIQGNYPYDRKDLKKDPMKTGEWPCSKLDLIYIWDTKSSFVLTQENRRSKEN